MAALQTLLFQIGAWALVAWLLMLAAVLIATRPRHVSPGPSTDELESCRPAVANMLVNGWRCTPEAVYATVVDLAARGVLQFRRNGGAGVVIADPDPPRLTQYERRVMARLRERARSGFVPLDGLGVTSGRQWTRWLTRFRSEVAADARARRVARTGLNTDFLAGVALLPALALTGWAYLAMSEDKLLSAAAVFVAVLLVLLPLTRLARDRHRPTYAGRAAAAHWLGVRSYLREHNPELASETLGDEPVPDEYLPYAVALGLTPAITAQFAPRPATPRPRSGGITPAPVRPQGTAPTPEGP